MKKSLSNSTYFKKIRTDSQRPQIPLPLPITKRVPILEPSTFESLRALVPELKRIIDAQITEQHRVNFYDIRKPNYPQGDSENLTFMVEIFQGTQPSTSWFDVMNSLRASLKTSSFGVIDVEIVDESRAFMPAIFPQTPTSDPIQIYETVRDDIISLLVERLPSSCNSMSLFRFGKSFHTASPSIVIFVEPFAVHNWHVLNKDIKTLFTSQDWTGTNLKNVAMNMEIVFVPGRILTMESKDFRSHEN